MFKKDLALISATERLDVVLQLAQKAHVAVAELAAESGTATPPGNFIAYTNRPDGGREAKSSRMRKRSQVYTDHA